jgi:hypothetical protein
MKHKGLNQLLCAATVNNGFRETLLHNPAQAIATGYFDHTFSLTPEERDLVISIQAQKLEDFAAQVYHWISGNGNGNGHRQKTRVTAEPFVDLYNARAPVAA